MKKIWHPKKNLIQSEYIRNLFKLRKQNNENENQVLKNVSFPFEEDKVYYEPVKTKGTFDDRYLEFESNGDRYKKLSLA